MTRHTRTEVARRERQGLDHAGYATLTGSRRLGPPGRGRGRRSGKRWLARYRTLRRWLLTVLGQEDFEAASRLLAEGLSCRQLGGELGKNPSTAVRLRHRLRDRLKQVILSAVGRPVGRPGPARVWVRKLLTSLAAAALSDATLKALAADPGGCTIAPRTGSVVGRIDAWVAAVAGHEERHRSLTFEAVRTYVRRRRRLLYGSDDLYLGAWLEDGQYCLDLTRLFPDQDLAVAFARANGQRAVTHLLTGRTVWLDELDQGQHRAA